MINLKTSVLYAMVLIGILTACQSELLQHSEVRCVSFVVPDYTVFDDEIGNPTKTVVDAGGHFTWAQADTVGIYPQTGAQIYFNMTSGASSNEATFNGGGWAFKADSVYYSYYPFIGDIYLDRHNIPVMFNGQKQSGTSSSIDVKGYDYMYTGGVSMNSNRDVLFDYHHLCCIIRPNVTLPAGTYTKLAITAPTPVFAVNGHYDLQSESPSIIADEYTDQLVIELENVTLVSESTFMVYLLSAPVNLQGVEITVSVLDSEKKEYQCKKTPSRNYAAGTIGGLTCNSFTEVPQSMGLIVDDWGDGGSIGGNAD